ncbi:MAG: polysaccharide biosynthesis protein [Proteobacteria bacterium]|nr:polysaccharide biosynthesis protein [Pseudomonadota bacterium]
MTRPINWRIALAFVHDACAAALTWVAMYWLRFNLEIPEPYLEDMLRSLAFIVPMQAAIFLAFGLYRGLWRFASLVDLKRIVLAAGVGALLVPLLLYMFRLQAVPRSVIVLYPLVLIFLMAGDRFAYRLWKEHRLYSPLAALGEPVLVAGAGEAGAQLTRELARSRTWRVVGLVDDDPAKLGGHVHGMRVLGTLADLPARAKRLGIRTVIIALPSASHTVRRRVAGLCAAAGIDALTVPAYEDLIRKRSGVATLRNVELDDLVGRDPVVLDEGGLDGWLRGRVVLVTGAGGSIGSELCRTIARFAPGRLVLLDVSEAALFAIQTALGDEFPAVALQPLVGDVRHPGLVADVMARARPHVVFHAAAYKHVPLMEEGNAWQAVRNNAYGTWVVACAAIAAGVEKFVLVSTDKAVNPTSVMGASKRLAEIVCQSVPANGTAFVIVRFGNVFGSAGSVIPRFREQIARGGPVTVTHPEITRYFMSIPEATQLVLQAGLMGRAGEILVLDMGAPVRIVDLARDLIRLSGSDPAGIEIVFTGLRPGEKLYEEVLADEEATLPTPHPRLRIAQARPGDAGVVAELVRWSEGDRPVADDDVRATLARWIPEYAPAAAGTPPATPTPS